MHHVTIMSQSTAGISDIPPSFSSHMSMPPKHRDKKGVSSLRPARGILGQAGWQFFTESNTSHMTKPSHHWALPREKWKLPQDA